MCPVDLPTSNLMEVFSQLRLIFPDNASLGQVDKQTQQPGQWTPHHRDTKIASLSFLAYLQDFM